MALDVMARDPATIALLDRNKARAIAALAQRREAKIAHGRINQTHRRWLREFRAFALERGLPLAAAGLPLAFLQRIASVNTRVHVQRALDALVLACAAAADDDDTTFWLTDLDGPDLRRFVDLNGLTWAAERPKLVLPKTWADMLIEMHTEVLHQPLKRKS